MHSNRYTAAPERKHRNLPRVLAATAAMLCIAALLLVLSVVQSHTAAAVRNRDGFRLRSGENVFYSAAGNGLAAATTTGAQLFNASGKCAASADFAMTEPMCAAGTQLAVFWDAGQNGIHALYPDGSAAESATEGGVYFADVNETGLITVLTDKDGYRGSVVVYDTDLTPLFRWDASSVTPVSARTTGKGLLCVNGAGDDGGYLRFFRIDREEMQAEFFAPGELIVDFGFLSDGSIAAVTETAVCFLSADGTLLSEHRLGNAHLSAFSLSGDFAAVAAASGLGGGETVITAFSPSGEPLGSFTAPLEAAAMSSCGSQLLVLFTGEESTLFSSALEEIVSYQPPEDVRQVFLCSDSRALFAGVSGVVQIDFNR